MEDDVLDVLEVLIEGGGRGADPAGDVDHAQVAHRLLVEERDGRERGSVRAS